MVLLHQLVEKILDKGFKGVTINAAFDYSTRTGVIGVHGVRLSEKAVDARVFYSYRQKRRVFGAQREAVKQEILGLARKAGIELAKVDVSVKCANVKYDVLHFRFYAASKPLDRAAFHESIERFQQLAQARGIDATHVHSIQISDKELC